MIEPPYANARAFLRSSTVAPGNLCRSSLTSDSSQTESIMLSWVKMEYEYNRGAQRNTLIRRITIRKRCTYCFVLQWAFQNGRDIQPKKRAGPKDRPLCKDKSAASDLQ